MNSINTYIHPNQLFEAEISSFGEPTLHDLRTDVESALRTRDEFINAYFPSSAAHYLRLTAMTALGLPLCAAIGMGGMCSGGIALSHAISAFLLEDANPSVVFMSSRWADGIVSTLGAALAGGLIYVGINSAVDILSANDISNSNENRKHLEKLNVNLSNAHQALANAIGRLPERALMMRSRRPRYPHTTCWRPWARTSRNCFWSWNTSLTKDSGCVQTFRQTIGSLRASALSPTVS